MSALDQAKQVQVALGFTGSDVDGLMLTKTTAAYNQLRDDALSEYRATKGKDAKGILVGDGTWPFTARIDGDDIVCENIVITCFGGSDDPQDDGQTASGISTKANPSIQGVSIAMDGRQFSGLSPAEHRALDGSPFPKMPWHTKVAVTINTHTFTPDAGIIDLGPGKQASRPNEPHALDLTPSAAALFMPNLPLHKLATSFEARGSFRILGGAKFV